MKYQALGLNVILEIPYESRWMNQPHGDPIKLETLRIKGVPLTIVGRGEQVKQSLQVGDQVLLVLGEGQGVNVIELDGVEYIFIQDFDIQIKINKEEKKLTLEQINNLLQEKSPVKDEKRGMIIPELIKGLEGVHDKPKSVEELAASINMSKEDYIKTRDSII